MVSHIGVHHGISLPFQSSRQAPGPRSFDSKLLCNSIPDLLSENVVDGPIISLLLSKFKSKPSEPAMQSKSSDFIHTLLIFPFRAQGGFRPFLRRGGGILFLTIPYPQRRLFRHEKSHRSFIRPPAGAGQRPAPGRLSAGPQAAGHCRPRFPGLLPGAGFLPGTGQPRRAGPVRRHGSAGAAPGPGQRPGSHPLHAGLPDRGGGLRDARQLARRGPESPGRGQPQLHPLLPGPPDRRRRPLADGRPCPAAGLSDRPGAAQLLGHRLRRKLRPPVRPHRPGGRGGAVLRRSPGGGQLLCHLQRPDRGQRERLGCSPALPDRSGQQLRPAGRRL